VIVNTISQRTPFSIGVRSFSDGSSGFQFDRYYNYKTDFNFINPNSFITAKLNIPAPHSSII
jgi:hypothetical protein